MDVLNVGLELNSVVGYSNPKGPRFNEFVRRGPPNIYKSDSSCASKDYPSNDEFI